MLLFLGQMALVVKMLSDTIAMSTTLKYEVLKNLLAVHLVGHKTTRIRRRINRQADSHIH